MPPSPDRKGRRYPLLFQAMNEVLRALTAEGSAESALERSFEAAAEGFAAENALLLVVEQEEPLRLRAVHVRGTLAPDQVRACEVGESVKGVSPSVIRRVIGSRRPELVQDPRRQVAVSATSSLADGNYSVLCAPIRDQGRDRVLAVTYFQHQGLPGAYGADDVVWLEGYSQAVGQAFSLHFARQRREQEIRELLQGQELPENAPELVGDSAHSQALRRELHQIHIPTLEAAEPEPVLIRGERGTGKDLVARYLHAYSARRDAPFVAINCAEITDEMAAARFFGHRKGTFTGASADEPGLFRAAGGGVLFLDEVAELSLRAQATLLRVLESRSVVPVGDTREHTVEAAVILATNCDLDEAVAQGKLRQDFHDRFRVQSIRLLPLRERPADIPALLEHFRSRHEARLRKRTLGFTQEALRALVCYAWPGNIRELGRVCSLLVSHAAGGCRIERELVERCYPDVSARVRQPAGPPAIWDGASLEQATRAFQRDVILARLERHNGNVKAARESLSLKKTTYHRYARILGIAAPQGEDEDD